MLQCNKYVTIWKQICIIHGFFYLSSFRGVRGEAPGWSAGDAGMVPLSLQVTAKGENKTTQLAALRQVSSIF